MTSGAAMRAWAVRTLAPMVAASALACSWARADPPPVSGARLWTAADIGSLTATLANTGGASTQILKGTTYGALVLRRAVSGEPELHVRLNDFFVVLGGEAHISVGGAATGVSTVAPDEKRGEKLSGGTRYRVRRGDVLFVPANHWLQVLVAKGHVLRALIIKTR